MSWFCCELICAIIVFISQSIPVKSSSVQSTDSRLRQWRLVSRHMRISLLQNPPRQAEHNKFPLILMTFHEHFIENPHIDSSTLQLSGHKDEAKCLPVWDLSPPKPTPNGKLNNIGTHTRRQQARRPQKRRRRNSRLVRLSIFFSSHGFPGDAWEPRRHLASFLEHARKQINWLTDANWRGISSHQLRRWFYRIKF